VPKQLDERRTLNDVPSPAHDQLTEDERGANLVSHVPKNYSEAGALMNEPIGEREALWNDFLTTWPIARLEKMTLPEYSRAGDKDCFTYWLESRTEGLGSIWGGSAFKFGIYGRKDHTPKPSGEGVMYGTEYAWAEKYGATPEEAFARVRGLIVQIARASNADDLQAIESADLGIVTKWKIAFLYQRRDHPSILNIYKLRHLRTLAGDTEDKSAGELHRALTAKLNGKHILAYGDELWTRVQAIEAAQLSAKEAYEILQASKSYTPVKPATEKMAGFENASHLQLALALDNKAPTIYLSPGPWLESVKGVLTSIDEYDAARSRSSNLAANAPKLAVGQPVVRVKLDTRAAFAQLLEAYDGSDVSSGEAPVLTSAVGPAEAIPLNQIFYGPPGTGKTYRTIAEAVRIIDPPFFAKNLADRAVLKQRFDAMAKNGQVQFVTFHQSFSYEDFVEGLRPLPPDDNGPLRYDVIDGIFKSICDAAETQVVRRAEAPTDITKRTIWKMSLGNTLNDEAVFYDECIGGGYALLGYGKNIDFSACKSPSDVREAYKKAGVDTSQLPDYAVASVATFLLKVKKHDLMVVTDGNFKFRAIGEVVGDYEFAPRDDWDGFAQKRRVKWLRVYEPSQPYTELMKKQFVQRTLYQLGPDSIDLQKLENLLHSGEDASDTGADRKGDARKVLIIDEINRGNVSRIFGELITLIEASKRKGQPEALEVILPYSKRPFSVPSNVYLIGTMNTADRSLTSLDVALRRRFAFVEIRPDLQRLEGILVEGKIAVGDLLGAMNARIEALLDRDHCIGHSYFMHLKPSSPLSDLAEVFRRSVIPLLQEYFFDDWGRIRLVLNDHRKQNPQHCFLTAPQQSIESLFGQQVGLPEDKRWVINESAFNFASTYLETIGDFSE
jgi:5-methylcytosine-specific restriction enzyme B